MYSDCYLELECVGKGTFGQAFKVISKKTKQIFLSKKIFLDQLTSGERIHAEKEVK